MGKVAVAFYYIMARAESNEAIVGYNDEFDPIVQRASD